MHRLALLHCPAFLPAEPTATGAANRRNHLLNTMQMKPDYYHAYVTANEKRLYWRDIKNMVRLARRPPGVDTVKLYLAISLVRELSGFDRFFLSGVRGLFHNHPHIQLREIVFKDNRGRDFSSFGILTRAICSEAQPHDYLFYQNRSGYGPFADNWLLPFKTMLDRYPRMALCGSTINFQDHPYRSRRVDRPHVQTYSFMATVETASTLCAYFPGENETERGAVVVEGEIGLSQFFLDQGRSIGCLMLPDQEIEAHTAPLFFEDQKERVPRSSAFLHRNYFRKNPREKIRNWLPVPWIIFTQKALAQWLRTRLQS